MQSRPGAESRETSDVPSSNAAVRQQRTQLLNRLFPRGVPRLWCPTVTHFRAPGQLDAARIRRHLDHLAPQVQGILVPGSTGEGWEMSDAEILELLDVVLDHAPRAGIGVLIGVLKQHLDQMLRCLDATVEWLKARAEAATAQDAFARLGVVGFTVCPPKGAGLPQSEIRDALARVLSRGLPTALYQLPQVTENEMSPQTVQALAETYPNLILFKDTSGQDTVARAGVQLDGVFLVRGAEGDYASWTRAGGGPYDGLLLSTANAFAPQLDRILRLADQGQHDQAQAASACVQQVVQQTFDLVAGFATGNPFTNANKLLDHWMAYGAEANEHQPPLLYSGVRLPTAFVEQVGHYLRAAHLFPETGYLNS
jgi:dihydrodipicolinate synthase/N-acetylneuraminate lyase